MTHGLCGRTRSLIRMSGHSVVTCLVQRIGTFEEAVCNRPIILFFVPPPDPPCTLVSGSGETLTAVLGTLSLALESPHHLLRPSKYIGVVEALRRPSRVTQLFPIFDIQHAVLDTEGVLS